MKINQILLASVTSLLLFSCGESNTVDTNTNEQANLSLPPVSGFNDSLNGKKVQLYYLKANGIAAAVTNYGGRLISLLVPNKDGVMTDVVLGYGDLKSFTENEEGFYGAIIGRYGNRIKEGRFSIDGKNYTLPINNGINTLHGGPGGFHAVVWDARQPNDSTLELTYLSKDGEQGFPGNLSVTVGYQLAGDGTLTIHYSATTDSVTVCNLTNHTYFNLNGSGTINDHLLTINADEYTPVDSTLIPLGNHASVTNTPFDFRTPTAIGARVNDDHEQLKFGKGYDHNFVINGRADSLRMLSRIQGDKSGIVMEISATEPGLQFYGGNFMQGKKTLKGGVMDEFRTAFCLEPQHFPNSPNEPTYPSTLLRPLEKYHTMSVYKFSVSK